MNQEQLNELKARAEAAKKVGVMLVTQPEAVLELLAEIERLRAEVNALENQPLNAYLDRELEIERLQAENAAYQDYISGKTSLAQLEAALNKVERESRDV